MAKSFSSVLAAIVALIILCCSSVGAADVPSDWQFLHWQDTLIHKESGVYEKDNFLFVHIRIPLVGRNRLRLKGMAMREFSNQLRIWAIEQTSGDRGAFSYPPAVEKMAALNDVVNSDWSFPIWHVNVSGRQLPSRESKGFFVQGQVYSKEALLNAIPNAYRRHPTQDDVLTAFANNARLACSKDRRSFAKQCGFFEFSPLNSVELSEFPNVYNRAFAKKLKSFLTEGRSGVDAGDAKKEWKKLNKELASSISKSSFCNSFIHGREVISNSISQVVVTNLVVSINNITMQAVTNSVESAVLVTNQIVTLVRDVSDRMLLSGGLLSRKSAPLVYSDVLPAVGSTGNEICSLLRIAPTDPRLWICLADWYIADNNPEQSPALSLVCLLNALSLTPSDSDIVARIALCYDKLGLPLLARGAAIYAYGTVSSVSMRERIMPLLLR